MCVFVFFFFKQKTAYELRISDWSSDVCSSDLAVAAARRAHDNWSLAGGAFRAERLERAADLLEEQDALFLGLAIDEAGKTLVDAVAEVREAVDFLRYYAGQARADFTYPVALPGPTGERNELMLRSEEHTSELQSLMRISYAVFC